MKTWLKVVFGVATSALLALLVMCIVLNPSRVYHSKRDTTRALTLNDILNGTFSYEIFFPNWISGEEYLHQSTDKNVILYNIETGESYTFLSNSTMKSVNASSYGLSSDRQFVYLESDYSKLWRYSYTATYHIYDLRNGEFLKGYELPRPIQYLSWSPVGNKLVYVYQNNIYLKQRPEDPPFQVTYSGKENTIFNGIPDWVYEEEMLATKYALWWSPNGNFLAYAEFNDTDIPVIAYSYYGEDQYPRMINIPYPKAGAKNPTVRIFIIDTTYPQYAGPREVPVPAMIASSDYYFSWITWVTDSRICLQWLKRVQNVSVLSICDFREDWNIWDCPKTQEHVEESRTGWAGGFFVSTPFFNYDSISYYKIFSDKDGYKHIHYIKDTVENAIQITSGKWEAINILRVTQDSLFYSSNEFEGYPGRRNIYRISIGSYPPSKKCVTCHLRKERCQYYTASFSYYAKYYALICYGPGLPISTLHDGRTDQEIKILEENKNLENALKNIQLPKEEIKKLEVDELTLWYKMIFPPRFDRSKKYPLLIQVYGGPCSQSVKKFIEMGFIDEKRIAIWGWSYGGYVSSLALASGTGLFKCGIAVAPVSSWEYYASVYTERFMGLPTKDDNLEHYKNSTVMARAEYFRNVDYLLIHGTADDNVHFQNSAQIAKALVNAQVDFQAMWYSDQNHGISGISTNHLYTHMTHFLKQCFFPSN
ncbi:prolyl endopeptidase FAP isoform X2 [Octodon degus]|uniref:Prolyl endopeptidase FAP isoform X2 n=1 Tax=Octodon degus TaxID=10160 RepID=A0A6P6EAX0_OCTDE|nr:prolyl endopeptidase FAP isoform X2 [Octodon degus]